jgi:AcrR family transcriptional regulator
MASISRAADVPEPTVYRLFSSKVGILRALLDVSIAGDDEPITVVDRPSVATLLDADGVDRRPRRLCQRHHCDQRTNRARCTT